MNFLHIEPSDIEAASFKIIEEELKERNIVLKEEYAPVIKRAIHTTADFDYAESLVFSKDPVKKFAELIEQNAMIVTDTNMALSGINKAALKRLGMDAVCFMADKDIAEEAKRQGVTRASLSIRKACRIDRPVIFAVGNAPTALIELREQMDKGYSPALVIGVPVGFVNVVESKELIIETDISYIVNRGRKGGSNLAAALINALMYMNGGR
ncbi:precorrin-8X methylmutase [Lachnospiraceae bacterium C1.1]|nr:precorrin-8X methylmutase [Lachnospiraceae bacterium C1.1]